MLVARPLIDPTKRGDCAFSRGHDGPPHLKIVSSNAHPLNYLREWAGTECSEGLGRESKRKMGEMMVVGSVGTFRCLSFARATT